MRQEVINSCAFITGRYVKEFEDNFANFCKAKHCIGVGNGTDALYISLKVLGIGIGDEVITVANSFVATSEAITQEVHGLCLLIVMKQLITSIPAK